MEINADQIFHPFNIINWYNIVNTVLLKIKENHACPYGLI